ncbi:MAG: site-specific DNA-methyltransferase [Defluviitaleaceae bacterium]|nr:site-specific DNA-methyltransferase [Defluviitaleaceae bacterium]
MPQSELRNNDCVAAMKHLKGGSVDMVLTDPPYHLANFMKQRATNLTAMRENTPAAAGWDTLTDGEWADAMDGFFYEAARVVKIGGSFIIFMSVIRIETLIKIAQRYGLYYKTTGIWHKTNPMPRNMHLHFVNSTEAWVYFVNRKATGIFNNEGKALHDFVECASAPPSERKHGKHPTQKPLKLMEFFIRTLTHEGETVLDPFMGSGSTGVAALNLRRNFIGFETDADYFNIAERRINPTQSPHTISKTI